MILEAITQAIAEQLLQDTTDKAPKAITLPREMWVVVLKALSATDIPEATRAAEDMRERCAQWHDESAAVMMEDLEGVSTQNRKMALFHGTSHLRYAEAIRSIPIKTEEPHR